MTLVGIILLNFFIGAVIGQNFSDDLSAAGDSSSRSSAAPLQLPTLDSKVFQVSPADIENNTAQFVRSDSSLNRLLALSNAPNLQTNAELDAQLTKTLSIDNLANQLGVTVTEQNLLGNFNNLNAEAQMTANEPLSQFPQAPANYLNLNTLESQSVNDFLNPNSLLTNSATQVNLQQPNSLNLAPLQSLFSDPTSTPNTLTLAKVYKSPVYELLPNTNNNQLQSYLQSILNQQLPLNNPAVSNSYQVQTENPLLDPLQLLLSQQMPNQFQLSNLYQPPNQLQTLLPGTNDHALNLIQSLLSAQPDPSLNNLLQVDQDLLRENLNNPLASLFQPNTNNLVTQIVFKNQVPNLHVDQCKTVFSALLQKAYAQYLKLASLPFCQQSGANHYPSSPLPFEVIIVPPKPDEPNSNSLLPRYLWLILQHLQNRPSTPDSNLSGLLPIILQLFPSIVKPPGPNVPGLLPTPTPKPDQSTLLLLLKLLSNQNQTPSQAYLIKVILEILKNKSPSNEWPLPYNPYDLLPDHTPQVPLPLPIPDFPIPLPDPEVPLPFPLPEIDLPLPLPGQPDLFPTPSPYELEVPELLNPKAKYVILIFKKYLPDQQLSTPDILFLFKLVNALPKTYNELLLNPQLLKQVILQLTNRKLNPKLVLEIIYNYLLQNNKPLPDIPNLNPDPNSKVVVLKYQVKRQPPFVYQPYFYVLYKLPYARFVAHLFSLISSKPYLKQNQGLLLKELLVLALANNSFSSLSSDINGLSKDGLVNIILNQGAVPLGVNVVSESNVLNEQLKVLNDLNSQLVDPESKLISQIHGFDLGLVPPSGPSVSGLSSSQYSYILPYLLNRFPEQSENIILPTAETPTTVNPFLQLLGNTAANSQLNSPLGVNQNGLPLGVK